jgi:hypothetical protein
MLLDDLATVSELLQECNDVGARAMQTTQKGVIPGVARDLAWCLHQANLPKSDFAPRPTQLSWSVAKP